MRATTSQITGVSTVYSTVGSGADQRKHQSSESLAFVISESPVISEFSAQKASNADIVSIWWRHHVLVSISLSLVLYLHSNYQVRMPPTDVTGTWRFNQTCTQSLESLSTELFLTLYVLFFSEGIKHIFTFYAIPSHWHDTGRFKSFLYIVNIVGADVLRRKEPGHRQPWYWLYWTESLRSPHVKV